MAKVRIINDDDYTTIGVLLQEVLYSETSAIETLLQPHELVCIDIKSGSKLAIVEPIFEEKE